MRAKRWLTVISAVFVLGVLLAACGGDDSGGSTGSTSTGGGTTATTGPSGASGETSGVTPPTGTAITIANFSFSPSSLAVDGKATITVTNNDTATHTFTADDGSFDEEIAAGQSVDVDVDVTETTPYHCSIHPTMTGTLTVG
jgi:plastocyanin